MLVHLEKMALPMLGSCLLCACGPAEEPSLEERLNAQPGFWFEARVDDQEAARLRSLGTTGYAQGYEPAPPLTGVLEFDETQSEVGFNLYSSGHAAEAVLMDMQGKTLHRWSLPYEEIPDVPPMEHPTQAAWRRGRLRVHGRRGLR